MLEDCCDYLVVAVCVSIEACAVVAEGEEVTDGCRFTSAEDAVSPTN